MAKRSHVRFASSSGKRTPGRSSEGDGAGAESTAESERDGGKTKRRQKAAGGQRRQTA